MPPIDCKYFGDEVINLLRKNKIFTVNDFLQTDFEKLVVLSKLHEKDVIDLIHKLITNYSAQPRDGLKLYQHLLLKTNIIQTFINGLDELLNGGLLTGTIVEFCGLSGSGKTQLCLSISLNVALKSKSFVTYIDTKRDFYSTRLLQILKKTNSVDNFEQIMERINIVSVEDIYHLITTLHALRNGSLNCEKIGHLIILDSLPSLFFSFIGLNSNEGLSLLNHIASMLKKIAVELHIAIILTNLGSQYEEALDFIKVDDIKNSEIDIKPLLGKYWLHVPNTRFIINKHDITDSERVLIVKKSDYIKIGNKCIINIFDGGVR